MENKTINLKIVAEVAAALQELKNQVVFVGGAVISLYTNDPAADEIRPTSDIDLTVELTGYADWERLQFRLRELKFSPDPFGHANCSFLYKNISIDIMPADDSSIGQSNSWYKPGFEYLDEMIVYGENIRILSAPYFLATKFEAFYGRGSDYRTSHDFEDIIYVLDNRIEIVEEILASDDRVKSFLQSELLKVISNPYGEEYIRSQIHPLMVDDRYMLLTEKINAIIGK